MQPLSTRMLSYVERHSTLLVLGLILAGSLRIASTYTVFNHTSDEPAHIACGMEWLEKGVYRWEPQHPPLARVATALLPYLIGLRSANTPPEKRFAMSLDGAAILYSGGSYDRNLALARLGILPFFWVGCWVVYAWGKRLFRPAVGVAAVFLFSFLPPVLAHAGLATTDMAVTALMGGAFLAGMMWLEEPTWGRAAWFGVAAGLMTLSKFSALVFFPVSAILALAWYVYGEKPGWSALAIAAKARIPSFALALFTGAVVIWAGYRFSFGDAGFWHLRLPAPELYAGIRQVMEHNQVGQDSYLLGERGHTGFWLFFPVALAVKSPLGFLVLLVVGLVLALRRPVSLPLRVLVAFSAGILLIGMSSRINIGLRHILPIYVGLSLLSAVALVQLLEWGDTRRWLQFSLAALVLWMAGSSLLSHPDYLPYFNELAGSEPEKILVDSDLDWGQDLKRLAARLRELGVTDIAYDPYILGDPEKQLGFPRIHPTRQSGPSPGWNAMGISLWKESGLREWAGLFPPRERVGKSILLWYFPPVNVNAGIGSPQLPR